MAVHLDQDMYRGIVPEKFKNRLGKQKQIVLPIWIQDNNGELVQVFWDDYEKFFWYKSDDNVIYCSYRLLALNKPMDISKINQWVPL